MTGSDEGALPVIVLGSLNMDIIMRVPALPKPGHTILATEVATEPGGKGANQAVAARRMGSAVAMLGVVGDDDSGATLRRTLANEGVDVSNVTVATGAPTGVAAIAIDPGGENQIVVAAGANGLVDAAFVERAAQEAPAIRLTQLETPLAAVEAFLRGGALSTLRILNAAPFVLAAAPLFSLCQFLVFNEGELSGFVGSAVENASLEAIAEVARTLITSPNQTIIVTLGARGALAISAAWTKHVPAAPAHVIDTTGAGDCFCGTLAAALSKRQDLDQALDLATRAAAYCVARHAAIPAMPFENQLFR